MILEEKIILDQWKKNLEHINNLADKYNCPAILLDDFEGGIIGWRLELDESGYHLHVIYDENTMCEYWAEVNKCEDITEAYEWFDCNTYRCLPYYDHNSRPIITSEYF